MRRLIIPILFIVLAITSCYKYDPIEADNIPVYPITPNIINPPDTFKVIFPMRGNVSMSTTITFDSSAVWHIEKTSAFSARFWASRNYSDTTTTINLFESKNIAFDKSISYHFWCNNNNYTENRNLIVLFRKEEIDFSTHQPQF